MKYLKCTITAIALVLSTSTNAALVERLGGLAYYDTEADLTWLADANYAQTSGYDADGRLTWDQANTWAASINVGGVDGWRLAETVQPDSNCSYQSGNLSTGHNCTASEMGNLFYNVLGNSADSSNNTGPFSNFLPVTYWSATEFAEFPSTLAWEFSMYLGVQSYTVKSNDNFAWAVKSGDVSAVPVPAAVWLFASGLIGLVGVARRKALA